MISHLLIQDAQVGERGRCEWMLRASQFLPKLQSLPMERNCRRVVPQIAAGGSKVVKACRVVGMELTQDAFPHSERLHVKRLGCTIIASLSEQAPQAVEHGRVTRIVFGALGVGGLKMKIHKACIARLFDRNDQVLDAETIAEVAGELRQ